jgi:very-short-patch-repair endonuclease
LIACGVSKATISEWVNGGYLLPIYPRVYAVGHTAPSIESDLQAAILYAGAGAMLSHRTAAWWWGLTNRRPYKIELSTPRRTRPQPGLELHTRRKLPRVHHNRIPITTLAQTLLDYAAATKSVSDARYALAEADYHHHIDLEAVQAVAGQGKPGSRTLTKALEQHRPELARTRSKLERDFFALLEHARFPMPQINEKLHGFTVDYYWPEHRLVVELDGVEGHSSPAQVARDRRKDLKLRQAGETVRRYCYDQVNGEGAELLADLHEATGQ